MDVPSFPQIFEMELVLDVCSDVVNLVEYQSPAVSLSVVYCDVSESVGCFSIGDANLAFVLSRNVIGEIV
ncbi:MAG: hypothetical protein RLZZ218_1092 [Actinomycetota bacterium]